MRRRIFNTIYLIAVVLFAVSSGAQTATDLTGPWTLQASANLVTAPNEGLQTCDFSGSADVSQTGSDFAGAADLTLVSGAVGCPAEMTATLSGQIAGDTIGMGMLLGGNLGEADFSGAVAVEGGLTMAGAFTVTSGPFVDTGGSWAGNLIGGPPIITVPTLTGIGLTILVLLVLAAGGLTLRRQRFSQA